MVDYKVVNYSGSKEYLSIWNSRIKIYKDYLIFFMALLRLKTLCVVTFFVKAEKIKICINKD